jgi:hypothetical protein
LKRKEEREKEREKERERKEGLNNSLWRESKR